jgi:hypothetical protein
MKKVVIFFAVFALAAPVLVQAEPNVYITCENDGLTTTISYDATDAGVVRAFSMDLTVDGGAVITGISAYDAEGEPAGTTVPANYAIYMSSIDFGTDPNNVDGWGDPVASGVDALGGLGTAGITVELGSLYEMGVGPTPPLTGDLFDITVNQACNLTIEDTVQKGTRGGIVLEDGSGAELVSSGCAPAPSAECMAGTNPAKTAWDAWGQPDCWCYQRNCRGDINGIKTGPFWVQSLDKTAFRAAFNKNDIALAGIANGICADLNRAKTGPFRVQALDKGIFRTYFNQSETIVKVCSGPGSGNDEDPLPNTEYNFWTN